jgi:hypothetical protein
VDVRSASSVPFVEERVGAVHREPLSLITLGRLASGIVEWHAAVGPQQSARSGQTIPLNFAAFGDSLPDVGVDVAFHGRTEIGRKNE